MSDTVIDILESLRDSDGHICIWDMPEEFTVVEEGDWTQEHKYQSAEHIIKHKLSGRHFCVSQSRSGSYHSDWYYGESDLSEVKQVTETITVTKWVSV